jgi:tetratricopeptide (TPR) repeat protein
MLKSAIVRIPGLILVIACAACAPAADTLHLRNGGVIVADKVTVRGDRIYYEVGDSSYAIPAGSVEKIDRGSAPPVPPAAVSASAAEPAAKPVNTPGGANPQASPPSNGELRGRIIRDGRVDDDVLAALERTASPEEMASALFIAGRQEFEHGNREHARSYFERALGFAPDNAVILIHYAAVLVQLDRSADAVPVADRATRLAPTSTDAFTVLGFAYYRGGKLAQAITSWKHALQLRPDEAVQSYVAKAERELAAEAQFAQADSGHFSIQYEGATTSDDLRRQIQDALEGAYTALAGELGIQPQEPIPVALYTNQAFFDVTQAPSWSGAINDGKLRIPVQGVTAMTPDLARVLRHELTHSFINHVAGNHCPQWLHEGIAQLLEPRILGPIRGRHLAGLYAQNSELPLNLMELSFLSFSPFEATLAYDESLATAEYLRDQFGMNKVYAVLARMGEGSSSEMALRIVLHLGYSDLERQVGHHLAVKYGK